MTYATKRNNRIRLSRYIGWATVAALILCGGYIGLKKQEQIYIERNV